MQNMKLVSIFEHIFNSACLIIVLNIYAYSLWICIFCRFLFKSVHLFFLEEKKVNFLQISYYRQ